MIILYLANIYNIILIKFYNPDVWIEFLFLSGWVVLNIVYYNFIILVIRIDLNLKA